MAMEITPAATRGRWYTEYRKYIPYMPTMMSSA
jgi:hypothetical protein